MYFLSFVIMQVSNERLWQFLKTARVLLVLWHKCASVSSKILRVLIDKLLS